MAPLVLGVDPSTFSIAIATWPTLRSKTVEIRAKHGDQFGAHTCFRAWDAMQIIIEVVRPMLVVIEAPVLAGARNIQSTVKIAQVVGAMQAVSPPNSSHYVATVPPSQWKRDVVGRGSATKQEVSEWVRDNHRPAWKAAAGDQNRLDALCIAEWGGRQLESQGSMPGADGHLLRASAARWS